MRSGKFTKLAAIIAVTASLAACVPHHGQKQVGGTLIGAGLGGLLGSTMGRGKGQLAAVAAGTLLGAFVGNSVGRSLDAADRAYAQRAAQRSLEQAPAGQVTGWKNPDSGNSGTYTPTRTYETAGGRYCREYQQTITVGGRTERARLSRPRPVWTRSMRFDLRWTARAHAGSRVRRRSRPDCR